MFAYRERQIYKEAEFHKVLEKLGHTSKAREGPGVDQIYEEILENFDESNALALDILQKKYEQNINLMDRRCSEIATVTKEELSKVKKLSEEDFNNCLLYTSPSPRDQRGSRMPSSA